MRKCQKRQTKNEPTNERRKSVTFDPANNNTRIFHKRDTPISIKREFKKEQIEQLGILKPILRYATSSDDLAYS
jgi:hypothetical protein